MISGMKTMSILYRRLLLFAVSAALATVYLLAAYGMLERS
jgi:hypothetical protein